MKRKIKFRPILFSTPMVQALRSGTKEMTRRKIHINPRFAFKGIEVKNNGTFAVFEDLSGLRYSVRCKQGNVGDGLYVKETYTITGHGIKYKAEDGELSAVKWKSSMFMPEKLSRTRLIISDLKVERMQDISTEDILKEGVRIPVASNGSVLYEVGCKFSPLEFMPQEKELRTEAAILHAHWQSLWKTINGENSWNENPFCWCISFREA